VNAALLDRAMVFAPASILRAPDLLTSEARLDGLEIFSRYQFDLHARDDGKFDILFRNRERDGWGQGTLEKLFLLFRGLPFQSITPEIYNLRHRPSTSSPCIAGMRRNDGFGRSFQVRSRPIQNFAMD
jgi:hypothetical protein